MHPGLWVLLLAPAVALERHSSPAGPADASGILELLIWHSMPTSGVLFSQFEGEKQNGEKKKKRKFACMFLQHDDGDMSR